MTIEREIPQDPVRQKEEIGRGIELLNRLKKKILNGGLTRDVYTSKIPGMKEREEVDRCPPGRVRDAIFHVLARRRSRCRQRRLPSGSPT